KNVENADRGQGARRDQLLRTLLKQALVFEFAQQVLQPDPVLALELELFCDLPLGRAVGLVRDELQDVVAGWTDDIARTGIPTACLRSGLLSAGDPSCHGQSFAAVFFAAGFFAAGFFFVPAFVDFALVLLAFAG